MRQSHNPSDNFNYNVQNYGNNKTIATDSTHIADNNKIRSRVTRKETNCFSASIKQEFISIYRMAESVVDRLIVRIPGFKACFDPKIININHEI